MSALDMKMSLGHSRHHLDSGTRTVLHELVRKEGRNSLVPRVLIGVCHTQTYANKKKKACSLCSCLQIDVVTTHSVV